MGSALLSWKGGAHPHRLGAGLAASGVLGPLPGWSWGHCAEYSKPLTKGRLCVTAFLCGPQSCQGDRHSKWEGGCRPGRGWGAGVQGTEPRCGEVERPGGQGVVVCFFLLLVDCSYSLNLWLCVSPGNCSTDSYSVDILCLVSWSFMLCKA